MSQALIAHNLPVPTTAGSLDAYISAVGQIPVLTAEDEQRLARQYRDNDDLDAARQLVMAHLRFVVHVARGYAGYGLQIGDLIQEGNVGLMKAVKRFDPEHGVRLVSFAVHWIRAEMHEFILRNWRIVKVATTKAQRKLFFNLRKSKKRLGWLNQREVEAVADDLGVKPEVVTEMESRLSGRDIGFDLTAGDDDDKPTAPTTWLATESPDPATVVETMDTKDQRLSLLSEGLEGLDERSRDIVSQRWLQEDKSTLQNLANRYGVSAERIRQIEANALKKMRAALAA